MLALALSLPLLLQLTLTTPSYALQCYNCSNIVDVKECLTITECRAGQSCYMDRTASGQTSTLGCTDNLQCGVIGGAGGTLVGRDLMERQTSDCHECCSTDKCNKNLCVHLKLDGNWAIWSSWSTCDVTCENGTRTRTRTCTDPAPANGGLDCSGSSIDTKTCLKELCPVHGGWAEWSNWEACSVTCGVGIERRNRNCSNPVPARFGDHCFGVALDDRICLLGPCASGGWTDWGQWSKCTMSCGGGIQSRSRSCTNPSPSPLGRYCEGDTLETAPCNRNTCTPNILFNARTLADFSPSDGQTMVFSTTLVNEGNAYSTSTGIFTAPVNATYSFSTQFCVSAQKHLYIAIVVDGVTYATAHMYDQATDSCNTAETVALLHANSKVWVKCTSSTSGDIIFRDDIYRISSFSGSLIH